MKKIVILHHNNGLGGAGMSLLHVHKMLENNYIVKTYIPEKNSKLGKFLLSNEVSIQEIGEKIGIICAYSGGSRFLGRTSFKSLFRIRKTKKAFNEIIENEKPDIVAVNSMTLAWAGKIIKKNNCKSLCFVRETYVSNIGMKYIKYFLDKYFDGVIFISEYDKKKLKCKSPVIGVVKDCTRKVDYILEVTKEEACRKLNIDCSGFNVLFVGGTNELKGWSLIESAIEKLIYYNIQLVVAGSTDRKAVNEKKNIKFIGSRTDMPMVYRTCDVLVFPSTSPHQARPVFEAGMLGLPVIISDFQETNESVRDGVNGITFTPNDANELARSILKLYNNRELCNKMGCENKEHAMQFHEMEKCKERLLRILNMID
jgi:glycosyltransferase involved in cell wall biosynthesis